MTTKEIEIYIPEDLNEVNIASAIVFNKIMKMEGLNDFDKAVQLIADLNNIDIKDVRALPIKDVEKISIKLMSIFHNDETEYSLDELRVISIDGVEYGLEPNFDKIETGAYIDLTSLLPDVESNLHQIMAILYRPIVNLKNGLYVLTEYSTEDDSIKKGREDIFLKKMPYSTVRSIVNFILSHIKS